MKGKVGIQRFEKSTDKESNIDVKIETGTIRDVEETQINVKRPDQNPHLGNRLFHEDIWTLTHIIS